ncbi:hypothetical protein BDY19DRAFT_996126 [Irpex rosettiformis]|uniref:Uncharacterized protein n=1 Tax=Irpex rosettiformis TaxID=378272 RepID=A0ACB8TVZ9_9APHY|nr:hypothetical protein BDY19DRAFT_996126 [Irpex rosettiformis]
MSLESQPVADSHYNSMESVAVLQHALPAACRVSATTAIQTQPYGRTLTRRVPDEILDIIIRNEYSVIPKINTWELPQTHWAACSLVCRQWRSVALAYLFRRIWISWDGRGVKDYSQFFSENKSIARLVKHVHINSREVDVGHLDSLLESLPGVISLHMIGTHILHSQGSTATRIYRNYALKYVQWMYEIKGTTKATFNSVLDLLSLFSTIERLDLFSQNKVEAEVSSNLVAASIATALVGRPQVHALSLKCGTFATSFLPTFLSDVGGLRNLTQLDFTIYDPYVVMDSLNDMLCSAGATLQSLRIRISDNWVWLDKEHIPVTRDENLLALLHRGFAACSSLEKFTLSTTIYGIAHGVSQESWLLVVDFFLLIPALHLQHLCLKVDFVGDDPDFVHSAPWHRIRDACHRFLLLRSCKMKFTSSKYSSQLKSTQCVTYEMQDFKNILCFGNQDSRVELRCDNEDCRKFTGFEYHSDSDDSDGDTC